MNIPPAESNSKATIPHHPNRRFVGSPKPPSNKAPAVVDMAVGLKNFSNANGAIKNININ